ncbi:MAG: hypothetical protein ACRDHL_07865 [Candidatus Promineifilaceae bacterium]
MAKRKVSKWSRRSTAEKVVIVLGILIAASMILSLFVAFNPGLAN